MEEIKSDYNAHVKRGQSKYCKNGLSLPKQSACYLLRVYKHRTHLGHVKYLDNKYILNVFGERLIKTNGTK